MRRPNAPQLQRTGKPVDSHSKWAQGSELYAGTALVLALRQMGEHELGPFARANCTRAAIHLMGRVVSLRSRAATASLARSQSEV